MLTSGNTSDVENAGLDALKNFGFKYEKVFEKDETFSGVNVFRVTNTEHNNPNPVLRNKDIIFHTCVLSRCEIGEQGKIMNKFWSPKGIVAHAFFFTNGDILLWRDPTEEKGQMAGPYNSVALEALVETKSHRVSTEQIASINRWIKYCNHKDVSIQVRNLLSHSEARGSGRNGQIDNMDEMRRTMELFNATLENPNVLQ